VLPGFKDIGGGTKSRFERFWVDWLSPVVAGVDMGGAIESIGVLPMVPFVEA
jgi:hypothetical protein